MYNRLYSKALYVFAFLAFSATLFTPATNAQNTAPSVTTPELSAGADNPLAVILPQEKSDMRPDPNQYYGRLKNGMTFLIYRQHNHTQNVSLRLRIGAGSMMESDAQWGAAHFIEHMAFEGTKNISAKELTQALPEMGVTLGPDAGAFTKPGMTYYKLDLPTPDDDTLQVALYIFREMARNILFAPAQVEQERKIILGEMRTRHSPAQIATDLLRRHMYAGTPFAAHGAAIGTKENIEKFSPAELRVLYHALYRPETTTLIIVGDVDPAKITGWIYSLFDDWNAVGPAQKIQPVSYHKRNLSAFAKAVPDMADLIQISYFSPFDRHIQMQSDSDKLVFRLMLTMALNSRLHEQALKPESAFTSAYIRRETPWHAAARQAITILPKNGRDHEAFVQAMQIWQQFKTNGVTDQEIKPILANINAIARNHVQTDKGMPSTQIADVLMRTLDTGSVFTSPEKDQADIQRLEKNLTAEKINHHLKDFIFPDGPVLSHIAANLKGYDAADMLADYKAIAAEKTVAYKAAAVPDWPYTDFGTAQMPISHTDFKAFGMRRYHFANGLILNIKSTQTRPNKVLVRVRYLGGLKAISPHTRAPVTTEQFYTESTGYTAGGLKKMSLGVLQKSLMSHMLSVTYQLGEDAATVTGRTTPQDLLLQMQLLMALHSDPAYNPDGFARLQSQMPAIYRLMHAVPAKALALGLDRLTHVADARFRAPSPLQEQAISFREIRDLLQSSEDNRPIEISIVGDVSPQAAVKAVATTFATLPKLPEKAPVADGGAHTKFPARAETHILHHSGPKDQSLTMLAWPVPGEMKNTQTSRGLEVLCEILKNRIFKTARQKNGLTYDPQVLREQSYSFADYGYIATLATLSSDGDKAFTDTVAAVIRDLKQHPVSAAELEDARTPLLQKQLILLSSDAYWADLLPWITASSTQENTLQKPTQELEKVTPAMLQALVKTYFSDARMLHIKVLPAPPKA